MRVLRRSRRIVGHSLCRGFGRGHVTGPAIACDDDDAIHLTAVHMEALRGQFLRVDTRSRGPLADVLSRSGLSVAEAVTTMSRGRRVLRETVGEPSVFGLAGHALG